MLKPIFLLREWCLLNHKILKLEFFCWLSMSHQNQQNFKLTIKMIPLQGPAHHPEVQYFYLKFWHWSVLYHISLWLEKLNGFLMQKHSTFQNRMVENFKNFEILWCERDFFQAITFDIFMLANWNFPHVFYTGNATEK